MTAYPAAGDYYKAVQAPARVFTVPKLQAAEFVWDSLGPTLARGSSAVVFQASVEGRPQALRCYIRNDASSRDRYSALDAYLATQDLSRYVSGTTWLDGAIQVNRATWPVLTMDWIDGRTLNEYVDFLVTGANAAALTTLAAKWRELVALLQNSEFTHGDLQHGNIMVDQAGRLRLVDFDGVRIPQLAGQSPPTEFGHPNYQHPLQHVWGRWLDTFSALVIYLSLVALGKDPALWLALYNSKNLLFAKNDFFPPFKTETWKQLAAMGDPQVNELVRRLQECCDPDWVSAKSLEMTLDQQAVTPVRQPIPVEQRWWEKKPVAATGSAVAGSAVAGSAVAGSCGFSCGGFPRRGFRGRRVGFAVLVPGDAAGRPASYAHGSLILCGLAVPRPVVRRGHRGGPGRDREDRGGFPSGPASAFRAARPGGYRADAATEPDDGAPGRHHLVVRTGIGVLRRVQARAWTLPARATVRARASRVRALWVRASRASAPRAGTTHAGTTRAGTIRASASSDGHQAAAGTGRRRHRAGPRDRAPDRRRGRPRVRHRDRRTDRRRLGHLAARHRGRDQTARPDVTPATVPPTAIASSTPVGRRRSCRA